MLNQELADKLAGIAQKQIDAALKFRQARMEQIKQNEDLYANKYVPPVIPGLFNIPIPIMGGFVDTLVSELNQPININFDKQEIADVKKAKRVTAAWQYDSSPTRGAWRIKDLRAKRLAAFSGRAIFNIFSESDPEYRNYFYNVHHYNFYSEPKGGGDLNNHRFCGEMNIFKSKWDLENNGSYDQGQVKKLLAATADDQYKRNADIHQNILNSYRAMGLPAQLVDYVGETMLSLSQHEMRYEGKTYYLLLDPITGLWVRADELKNVIGTKRQPDLFTYTSYATHDDPNNFLSKAPADDVRPIAIALQEVLNQGVNQLMQRMRGKRLVAAGLVNDLLALEDFTTRFVEATPQPGKQIGQDVFEFQTPDNTSIVVNLTQFLNGFLGEKTGITPATQGNAKEDKVGIYVGNVQQVSRRMSLYSDFVVQAYTELGLRYALGLNNLRGAMAIKMIGSHGYESDDVTRSDADTDFDIRITGGADDEQMNAQKRAKKEGAIARVLASPILVAQYNPKWLAEQNLEIADYDAAEIRKAMDLDTYSDNDLIAEADQAIQEMLKGKTVKDNRRANTAFVQYLYDFLADEDVDFDKWTLINDYMQRHIPIALQNMIRKARLQRSLQGQPTPSDILKPSPEQVIAGRGGAPADTNMQ